MTNTGGSGDVELGSVLRVADACLDYQVEGMPFRAVDRVSFDLGRSEFIAVVGPSGCGKTSLLKAVAGLEPVSAGAIELHYSPGKAPFAMVFQAPSLFPWRTVLGNAAYGVEGRVKDRGLARSAARAALRRVGLTDYERFYPGQLSGGMQQRVNLARALAIEPQLLLLDEPFSSLDAQLRERMQLELTEIWQGTGSSALFITHQVDEAIFLSDRVLVMSPRPARVVADMRIEIPRPRALSVKRADEFQRYESLIWSRLDRGAGVAAPNPVG